MLRARTNGVLQDAEGVQHNALLEGQEVLHLLTASGRLPLPPAPAPLLGCSEL